MTKLYNTARFIKDNKIILPKNVMKITGVFQKGIPYKMQVLDLCRSQFPSIKHHNPQVELTYVKTKNVSSYTFMIVEMTDGKQQKIGVSQGDTTEKLLKKVINAAENMNREGIDQDYVRLIAQEKRFREA
ncbi:D-ribose pyranase [Acrasis kona]|uniref:D-ribose pyranase n=1 Tax=Acrasis kona TaxID=1008807 RepID=A0AAW2YV78_9EUKA